MAAAGIAAWKVDGVDGASLWGRVSLAQIEVGYQATRRLAEAPSGPIDAVTDLSGVTSFDDAVYLRMAAYVTELGPRIEPRLRSHVLIVPDGVLRAAMVGFLHLHMRHGWSIEPALPASIAARVAALVEPRRDHDLVTALRTQHTHDALPDAAKALGVAPRTLQRALHGAGTCFRAVVEEARIAEACRLLDHTDLKVEAVAREVGFQSLSGFVRSFRSVCGQTPSERRVRLIS